MPSTGVKRHPIIQSRSSRYRVFTFVFTAQPLGIMYLHRSATVRGLHTRMLVLLTTFTVMSALAAVVSIVLTPPFQTPDAFTQFDRAVQISRGDLVGAVAHRHAGGYLPSGVLVAERPFRALPHRYQVKVSLRDFQQAAKGAWTRSTVFVSFAATTEYPPVAYLPAALALGAARLSGLSVLASYYVVEFVNAAVFIALVAWSLTQLQFGEATIVAAVAMLPMELALAASPSTDGLLFGLSCVYVALTCHRHTHDSASGAGFATARSHRAGLSLPRFFGRRSAELTVAALILAAIGGAKPPYLLLFFLSGLPGVWNREWSVAARDTLWAAIVGIAPVGLWYLLGAKLQGAYAGAPVGSSIRGQVTFLISHLSSLGAIVPDTLHSFGAFYFMTFIGDLGWLDTPLSAVVYVCAAIALGALAVIVLTDATIDPPGLLLVTGTVAATIAAVFLALYLDWTPVGAGAVFGVQGRYFLPLVPAAVLAAGHTDRLRMHVARVKVTLALTTLAALTLVGSAGATAALVQRYWIR